MPNELAMGLLLGLLVIGFGLALILSLSTRTGQPSGRRRSSGHRDAATAAYAPVAFGVGSGVGNSCGSDGGGSAGCDGGGGGS
jgi:hypothetical protein